MKQRVIVQWTNPEMQAIGGELTTGVCMGTAIVDIDKDEELMALCVFRFCQYYGFDLDDFESVAHSYPEKSTDERVIFQVDFEGDLYTVLKDEVPSRD